MTQKFIHKLVFFKWKWSEQFSESGAQETLNFKEQIETISKDKYMCIISSQAEAIRYIPF